VGAAILPQLFENVGEACAIQAFCFLPKETKKGGVLMEHHFHVSLTDEQLTAAKAAAAARGVTLGPVGSLNRDGVTLNYTIEKDDAGANDVSVDIVYWPFYVPVEALESQITAFLTGPPVEPPSPAPPQ
jgi:hypothetical protein